jgi:hypothetical protein
MQTTFAPVTNTKKKVYRLLEEELDLNISSREKQEVCFIVSCYGENDVG